MSERKARKRRDKTLPLMTRMKRISLIKKNGSSVKVAAAQKEAAGLAHHFAAGITHL
jgi:hypothetical protein